MWWLLALGTPWTVLMCTSQTITIKNDSFEVMFSSESKYDVKTKTFQTTSVKIFTLMLYDL